MEIFANGTIRCAAFLLVLFIAPIQAGAQQRISCPTEEHVERDVRRLMIEYDGGSFAGTLNSLSALGVRMEVAPGKLQEAAVASRRWDVFLKGLGEGYNRCAVSEKQYAEGLSIYPRLKEDAARLEEIRKAISNGQKAEAKQIQAPLDSYYANLRRFAQISGKYIIVERIEAVAQSLPAPNASAQSQLPEAQKTAIERILARLDDLETRYNQVPLPTPKYVDDQLSDVKESQPAKADAAEAAYRNGYELSQRYRFREAVPYFQKALAAVPLPEFYLALGRAYRELPDLAQAESILRKGLAETEKGEDTDVGSELAAELGSVLLLRGDPDAALSYTQRALKMDEKIHGADQPEVAVDANSMAQILQAKGDLEGALTYSQRALRIDQTIYGPDRPEFVAIDANNIGTILKAKGDLDKALSYAQRALTINEKVYGPDHPQVAIDANNIGTILKAKGALSGALTYIQRAMKIEERIYGPDHPQVLTAANNIGQILEAKGDLEGALSYTERALRGLENSYGPNYPMTKQVAADLERIKAAAEKK
jgi:tetratricopeptide (TPR) repeat protein